MNYWIGVVSRDHVRRGVDMGIAQLGHGKRAPLARLHAGDGFIYYSPKTSMQDGESLQAFTAIGTVADDEIWQADEGTFQPYRRRITYKPSHDAPIAPLLPLLSFTAGNTHWGYAFRYGFVSITEEDYQHIARAMGVDV